MAQHGHGARTNDTLTPLGSTYSRGASYPTLAGSPFSAARPTEAMRERIASFTRARAASVPRWEPVRAIVQNYFVSPYQEFYFVNGCLVLGGGNGTGKTSLLTAFLTLVLDNDKRPERLDPGGSRDRSIAYYVLGEADKQFFHRNRTAYLALEFCHAGTGEYRTIGIGLHGVRAGGDGQPRVDSWGFLLADGRRVGHDLHLFVEDGGRRIPLSQTQLVKELGGDSATANRVVEGVADYQELVNAALFGFRSSQQFRDLLDILTELRASKLDNNIRPTTVNGMLQRSLQPLDPALMEEAGRVYERIDHFQDKLDLLQEQVIVLDDLQKAEATWRRAAARREAALFRDAHTEATRAAKRLEKLKADIAREQAAVESAQRAIDDARDKRSVKTGRLEHLLDRPELKDIGRLDAVEERLADAKRVAGRATDTADAASGRHAKALADAAELLTQWHATVDGALTQARDLAETARRSWPRAAGYAEAVATAARSARLTRSDIRPLETIAGVRADHEVRRDALQEITRGIRTLQDVEGQHAVAVDTQTAAAADLRAASEAHAAAHAAEGEGRVRLADGIRTWATSAPELSIPPEALDATSEALLEADGDPDDALEGLEGLRRDAETTAREQAAVRGAAVGAAERALADAETRLATKRSERDEAPALREATARARAVLEHEGIAAEPLYRAVDFADRVAPEDAARLEATLTAAGVLNALLVAPEDRAHVEALLARDDGGGAVADTWVIAAKANGRPAADTLAAYLRPVADGPIAPVLIQGALDAIAVVPSFRDLGAHPGAPGTAIALDGGWRHGTLAGHSTDRASDVRYIGATNRQRAREAAIRALEGEVAVAAEALDEARADLEGAKGRVEAIVRHGRDLAQLPALRALKRLLETVRSAENDVAKAEQRETAARQKVAASKARVTAAKEALDIACHEAHWTGPRTADAVDLMVRTLDDLRRAADALEGQLGRCSRALADQVRVATSVEPLEREAASAAEHAMERQRAVLGAEEAVRTIRELLDRPDVKKLRAEVEELRFSIKNLDTFVDSQKTERDHAEGRLEQHTLMLEERESAASAAAAHAAQAYEVLLGTLEAHTATVDEAAQARVGVAAAAGVAEVLLRELPGKEQDAAALESAREAAFGAMDTLRRDHTAVLNTLQPHVDRRTGCTFVHHGRQLPTHLLFEELREEQLKLEDEVSEHHRILMQRFLSEEILSAIHTAIKQTKDLIELVNDKLAHVKTSKGRQLRFVWTPVRLPGSATSVADVAKLLETRVAYLSDDDRATLVAFIQERLTYVRATVKRGDAALSYVDALKQALDYRHWYQFSMQALEKRWVEFTDKKFGAGSNGEKAVDMLAPLFAVVHARYASAAPDAPRLLGMDEAFAGVDATNTKAMFGLLRDFEFSFLMTSEKLWGVSENLPGCATYQLQVDDPKDPSTLAATFFLWDGIRRTEDAVGGEQGRPGRSAGGRLGGGQGELVL